MFLFDIEKLIQTCNYIIKKNNNSINYTKLIKLLYLSDKESLKNSLQAITGDKYVSMDNGPVLSGLYDLIKGRYRNKDVQDLWNKFFFKNNYNLDIINDQIRQDELSVFELQILDQIYEKFRDFSVWDMVHYVHMNCPEWKDPEGTSIPIQPNEILESVGKSSEEIDWILAETRAFEEEERAMLSLAQ
jgi:uncharacterized phage-associated protein